MVSTATLAMLWLCTVVYGSFWIVQCFTSLPTQYRLYGRRFLQVKRPNQQYQSTEGTYTCSTQTNQSYNNQTINTVAHPVTSLFTSIVSKHCYSEVDYDLKSDILRFFKNLLRVFSISVQQFDDVGVVYKITTIIYKLSLLIYKQ